MHMKIINIKLFPSFILFLLVVFPSRSVQAQVDLVGEWSPRQALQNTNGMDIGDYTGIPINEAARFRAESYSPDQVDLPENECRPIPADMGYRVLASNFELWSDVDYETRQIIAYHTHLTWGANEETIWMDGRPHPSEYAPHTFQGFSTGKWEGNTLVVTTDHLKEGYLTRGSGVFRSDRSVETRRITRYGNYLIMTFIIDDPAYFTEPYIITSHFVYNPAQVITPFPCEIPTEGSVVAAGTVPNFVPGENPLLHDFAAEYGMPSEAALGGAETDYPEYIEKMKTMKKLPKTTTQHVHRGG